MLFFVLAYQHFPMPVQNEKKIYWQTVWKKNILANSVFFCTDMRIRFTTYWQDFLYWHAHQKKLFASTKWKITYWLPTCFCTGAEQILKHTDKQLYTGKHIKFCHLPVHTDNRLYWQDMFVLYWHRTIFQPYWQDRIYSVSYGMFATLWSCTAGPCGTPDNTV